MSWDITISDKKCSECGKFDSIDVGNYTYNVGEMYFKAMGVILSEFNGKSCAKSIPILARGIKNMRDNPDDYIAINPSNGWGNYDGALKYLEDILKAAKNFPDGTIFVG